MINDYVRKVHSAMQTREEDVLLVNKIMLTDEDIELLKELSEIYNKTIIFGSTREMIINKDNNIFVIQVLLQLQAIHKHLLLL